MCNIKNDVSAGFDGINVRIVKRVIHLICIPLCKIFNISMETGVFPAKLKIAKVVPVYIRMVHMKKLLIIAQYLYFVYFLK